MDEYNRSEEDRQQDASEQVTPDPVKQPDEGPIQLESRPHPVEDTVLPHPHAAEPLEPVPARPVPHHVLPPRKYKLKTVLLFSDFFAIVLYFYFLLIRSIIQDIGADNFSAVSNRMISFYCVLIITIALTVLVLIFKMTRSAMTRFERENEVRQDENLKIWLVGYDWGWPVLFLPTMVLMTGAGVVGLILTLFLKDTQAGLTSQAFIGGIVIVFGSLNAAVVIFKLKPVTLGLLVGSFCILLLILLLHGPQTFINFFKSFRHLGIKIEPLGYILLAYIWSIFLRIIWLKSLFYYWVFVPNRLELQHGLSESNDSVDREDLRLQIDTDDVILRWWNVGIITFYFPDLDRLPVTNVVWGIRKKAFYANRIASVKTMQD